MDNSKFAKIFINYFLTIYTLEPQHVVYAFSESYVARTYGIC